MGFVVGVDLRQISQYKRKICGESEGRRGNDVLRCIDMGFSFLRERTKLFGRKDRTSLSRVLGVVRFDGRRRWILLGLWRLGGGRRQGGRTL